MKKTTLLFYLLCFIISQVLISCSTTKIDNPEISISEVESHIKYLASDELKGRYPGTEGDQLAAEYIAQQFQDFGLQSFEANYLQKFEVITSIKAGESSSMEFNGEKAALKKEFIPVSYSENTSLNATLCFAGYGFNIDTDKVKWNDYSEIDYKGKWVLMLKGEPEIDSLKSPYMKYAADRDKVMLAKDLGAGGVLFVSGPAYARRDMLPEPSRRIGSTGLPVFHISRELANKLLEKENKKIEELESALNKNRKPMSFNIDININGSSVIEQQTANTYNVVGYLEGNDPNLKDEYVIIGAHYDHLGMGGKGSSSRKQDTIGVHSGADDNASGTAAVIELAEKFAAQKQNLKRSIVFIAFGAEEMGLLGSKHFVDHMKMPANKVSAMLNMDMIGRLSADSSLEIGGVGTALEYDELLNNQNKFNLATTTEGYGPSDHASFYGVDIPVLHISTGAHLDYHTPEDSFDKINSEGLKMVADFVFDLASEINERDKQLSFQEAGPKTGTVSRKRLGVTLGIMPDFAGKIKNGLRADFVIEGKPAFKGGMKKGDIITAINGQSIANIQDYMYRLSKLKFGQTITVEVVREQTKKVLIIQL